MRFAVKTAPEKTTWDDMLAVWRQADEIELFESAWSFDHFEPIYGDRTRPCLEGWTTLAALAQATSRIRVGMMVTGTPYRHPAVLANMAATVDIVSGGRLELGLGAGWNESEAAAYGIDLLPLRQRIDRFDEACDVVVGLLTRDQLRLRRASTSRSTAAHCEPKAGAAPPPARLHRRAAARSARCGRWPAWPSTGTTWAARSTSSCGCGACSPVTAPTSAATPPRS